LTALTLLIVLSGVGVSGVMVVANGAVEIALWAWSRLGLWQQFLFSALGLAEQWRGDDGAAKIALWA
jgi:hypothetical protein